MTIFKNKYDCFLKDQNCHLSPLWLTPCKKCYLTYQVKAQVRSLEGSSPQYLLANVNIDLVKENYSQT